MTNIILISITAIYIIIASIVFGSLIAEDIEKGKISYFKLYANIACSVFWFLAMGAGVGIELHKRGKRWHT